MYIGVDDNHWINSVGDDGNIIKLEDGSVWKINPVDTAYTAIWIPATDILVKESDNPSYPYSLINKDDDETAEAKLISD
jgi:hypothetical protein